MFNNKINRMFPSGLICNNKSVSEHKMCCFQAKLTSVSEKCFIYVFIFLNQCDLHICQPVNGCSCTKPLFPQRRLYDVVPRRIRPPMGEKMADLLFPSQCRLQIRVLVVAAYGEGTTGRSCMTVIRMAGWGRMCLADSSVCKLSIEWKIKSKWN